MQLRLLGPVEATVHGKALPLGAAKQRALLAMLALHPGSPVSADELMEGLWGAHPPSTAAKMVQQYVSHLRRLLADGNGGPAIVTRGRGYELQIAADDVDASRFERLVAEGAPREALALWRGPPLADIADEPFAAPAIRRLEEQWFAATEAAIDLDLADGRDRELIGVIEALIDRDPLRERLYAQLMLALYRSGRQAEALVAYRRARATLVEQIGVEPGPELRDLHAAILRQDGALAGPAPPELPPELETSTTLLGRDRELDLLGRAWRDACADHGGVAVITGPRGSGRTRLAAELAAQARREGARVAVGADALAGIASSRRRTLLVLEDVAPAQAMELARLPDELAATPALVVATAIDLAVEGATHVALEPLDARDVAAIAAMYSADAEAIPTDELMVRSGGLPGAAHRLAADWARAAAARRLRAAAGRAAAERHGLRRAEDELAGDAVEVHALRERAGLDAEPAAGIACPFRGLAPFDVADAPFFFGRERLVGEMLARLAGAALLGVVGPSGSGKSSALRAGLLPELAGGVLPGSESWTQTVLRPGEHPMRALAESGAAGDRLIAVDQFEEIFALCRDADERTAFVDALLAAARRGTTVVIAVRADFYGRCGEHRELGRMLGANHVLVGPMRRDELRRAIERSARAGGLRVEPELVDRLLADVEAEPGALPLLSTALLELWEHRDGRRLTLAAYERTGGVRGAVARLAEGTYGTLREGERDVARAILLRLAGEQAEGGAVRRPVALSELDAGREDVRHVLGALADGRLVTLSQDRVEVAHEALLREWPRLRDWIAEDVEGRRLHHHLAVAAREWEAGGRDPAELYRGARLAAALDWNAQHRDELNAAERAFLHESRAEADREARRARVANRRLRALLAGVAAMLVLALVAGTLFFEQRGTARDEARSAEAQRLGAQALVEEELDLSLLLARQGTAIESSPQTRGNLLAALLRSPAAVGVAWSEGDRLLRMASHPGGRTVAVGDNRGRLLLLDVSRPGPARVMRRVELAENRAWNGIPSPQVIDLEFSPDGSRLAVSQTGKLELLDTRSWRRIATPAVPKGWFLQLAFSPDSEILYAPYAWVFATRGPLTMLRFAASDGRRLGRPERFAPGVQTGEVLAFGPDGRQFVTREDGDVVVRDARTLRVVHRLPGGAVFPEREQGDIDLGVPEVAALAPGATKLAAGGEDGRVRITDLRTGVTATASGRHDSAVTGVQFAAGSELLVTIGDDARALVWDVEQRAVRETLAGHAGRVLAAAVDDSGRTLHTAGLDSRVITWDLAGDRRLGRPFAAGRGVGAPGAFFPSTAISADGRTLVTNQRGGVSLIDTATFARRSVPVPGGTPEVNAPAFAADGRIAVAGLDGFLALVDVETGRVHARMRGHENVVFTPVSMAGGRRIVTTGLDATLRVWDGSSGSAIGRPIRLDGPPGGHVAVARDGRTVAVPLARGTVDVYDVSARRRVARLSIDGSATVAAAFSRDGDLLVAGSDDGRVRLFSTADWRPLSAPLEAHAGFVSTVDVSPDGRHFVTAATDGQVRLWDRASRRPIGTPLPGPRNVTAVAYFSPDGAYVYAVFANGRGYRWDVRPGAWERHACAVAGRQLARDEWDAVLPDRPFAPAC
jgi:DNA-binding SARP family transcriptional activator/WD40 repeat protein